MSNRPSRKRVEILPELCSCYSCKAGKPCLKAKTRKVAQSKTEVVVEDLPSFLEQEEMEEDDDVQDDEPSVTVGEPQASTSINRAGDHTPANFKVYKEQENDIVDADAAMWILTRITQVDNKYSYCTSDDLHQIYVNDSNMKDKLMLGKLQFQRMVARYYPSMISRRMVHPEDKLGGAKNVFLGIKILPPENEEEDIVDLSMLMVPQDFSVSLHTERVLQVRYVTTNYSLNGTPIVYTVTITKQGDIRLNIMGREIPPLSLGFPKQILMTNRNLQAVFKFLRIMVLCTGISLDNWRDINIPMKEVLHHYVEKWTKTTKGHSSGWWVRSKHCYIAHRVSSVQESKACVPCRNLKAHYVNRGRLVSNLDFEEGEVSEAMEAEEESDK